MNKTLQIFRTTYNYLKKYKHENHIDFHIRKQWAKEVFEILKFKIRTIGTAEKDGPIIYVSNHLSYVDIPLLFATIDDCVFVSKKEVSRWPLFGAAGKKIGTIFVDRNSANSRSKTRTEIQKQLQINKKKIVVFPSGTTSLTGEKLWRKGVFEIAQSLGIPVQPIRINYSHLKQVAYINQDFFPFHLYQLTKHNFIKAEVEIHKPIFIQNLNEDLEYCRHWCTAKNQKRDLVFFPT